MTSLHDRLRDSLTGSRPTGGSSSPAPGGSRALLPILAGAQAMIALDITVVNVALPQIAKDLVFGPGDLQWVISLYVLVTGGLLLLGGRLADLLGARSTFLTGLVLFTSASLVAGLAPTSAVLVIARGVQGLGAALMSPAALAVIAQEFTEDRRARAMGVWGAVTSGGAAAGLLVGGALTTWFGWRSIFVVNVPVGVVVFAAALALLPARRPTERPAERPNVMSSVLAVTGCAVLVYGISGAADKGWDSGRTITLLSVGIVLVLLLVVAERHSARPLVPPALWRDRALTASTIGIFGATIALVGILFLGAFLFQTTLGGSAMRAGLDLLPVVVAIAVAAHLGPALIQHLGARITGSAGLAICAGGIFLLTGVTADTPYVGGLLIGLILIGLGLGLSFMTVSTTAMSGVSQDQTGSASGLYMTSHDIGGAFAVALLSTAVASVGIDGLMTEAGQHRGFATAGWLTLGFAVVALLTMPAYRPPADGSGRRLGHSGLH